MRKLIRITTVPVSLKILLKGQCKFMSDYYDVIGISSDGSELQKTALDENITVIPVQMTRVISPVRDLVAVYNLFRIFKREKPFIVHTHTPKAGTVGMIAAKMAGVPNRLHTVAGLPLLEVTGNKRRLLNFVEKITYGCATKVYPNSFGLKEIIIKEKFCRALKLKVIANGSSNGINTDYFNSEVAASKVVNREQLGIFESEFVFIFVGRLVSDKGLNELVQAFKILSAEYNNVKLLLVGGFENDLDPLLPKTVDEINSNNKIISVGYKNDVRPYFALANALVFPSYREGFPNVVMQAGAMGLPSIVSNINGCNEIVIEDYTGIIIPVKSADAIFIAMKKMMVDEEYYMSLKKNVRKRIVENYEQSVVWQALLKEYKSIEINV
ncbi:glycosyltransferase family 4 protein [Flavobacterium sp. 14A]|uniref:glycosyltransferase family 4 protein n=1 Tax=Flavobacterium sp. 14A TaxID=2735896 RepID=UPI00156E72A8|nr:glycosyltransferase family 4 protein [Flavobacterium sp. 14A]NRT10968.1 glycosyltransferase involved in cell wall biosynthesis [Flavobacterium sp. 14A]